MTRRTKHCVHAADVALRCVSRVEDERRLPERRTVYAPTTGAPTNTAVPEAVPLATLCAPLEMPANTCFGRLQCSAGCETEASSNRVVQRTAS